MKKPQAFDDVVDPSTADVSPDSSTGMTSANTPPAEPDMGEASESDDAAPATETDDDSVSVALTAIGEGAKPGDMITMKVVSVSPDDGTAMLMPSMKKGTMAVKGKAYDLSGAMK